MEKFFRTQKKSEISRAEHYKNIAKKAEEDLRKEAARAGLLEDEAGRDENKKIVFKGSSEKLEDYFTE